MTLNGAQLDEILDSTCRIAKTAGSLLLERLYNPGALRFKGQVDLVTESDHLAEAIIRAELLKRFPEFGILAEEGGQKERKETRWIVDPLDGTTNFAHGHPIFAVSIGLEEAGALQLGVIAIPALGMTFWARRGGGAFCNGESITVSSQAKLDKSLVATGFPYDRRTADDDNTSEHIAFIKRAQGVRRCGAAAVDLALLARGVYDGFWEPKLHSWDLAAGVVIVEEAGGRTSGYEGRAVDIHRGWIVASNGRIHNAMLEVLSQVRTPPR